MEVFKNYVNKLKENWEQASPEQKRKIVVILTILGILLIGFFSYEATRSKKEVTPKDVGNVSEIKIQPDLLERSYYVEAQKRYEELAKQIEEMKKQQEILSKGSKETAPPPTPPTSLSTVSTTASPPPPPPPPQLQGSSRLPVEKQTEASPPPPPPKPVSEYVGNISIVSQKIEERPAKDVEEVSKEGEIKKKYYLPPSFMEATLLSGLDAPAIAKGESHPVPCLFRIKAPAVLPNKVKANLKGCFVIGEGLGNLASERADIRLVSLSCIDKKGRAVIDQTFKGFVVDSDGKIGLRGRVVSKMGGVIARALLAGFISGLGNVFTQQSYYYTYSPSGTLVVPKPEEILRGGLGTGFSQATQEIQKFYLELAKQTIPVVEILPTRNITLVVSKGTWLEVKDYEVNY